MKDCVCFLLGFSGSGWVVVFMVGGWVVIEDGGDDNLENNLTINNK